MSSIKKKSVQYFFKGGAKHAPIYVNPTVDYQKFVNAFNIYYLNRKNYSASKQTVVEAANKRWKVVKSKSKEEIQDLIKVLAATQPTTVKFVDWKTYLSDDEECDDDEADEADEEEIVETVNQVANSVTAPKRNAIQQLKVTEMIEKSSVRIVSLEDSLQRLSKTLGKDDPLIGNLVTDIEQERANFAEYQRKLKILKRNAFYQDKARKKRLKLATEEGTLVSYDSVGRPPKYVTDPELGSQIMEIIDVNGSASCKRRIESVNIRYVYDMPSNRN
jgi:Fe-S-cluster formation regulator IscX/YfhJ